MRDIEQGDIYWVNLGPIRGYEQAGIRPALVIQCNPLNRQLRTTLMIPLTTNLSVRGLMTTHFLPKEITKLKKDSVALLHQIQVVDQRKLKKKINQIDKSDYFEIRFKLIQNVWAA